MKSPTGFTEAPPKPAEVRRQGRNLRAKQDAERDAASADFYSQLGGGGAEERRLRMRERMNPGYTEIRARQLPEDRERTFLQRTRANDRKLERSIAYYGDPSAPKPSEPAPTVVADTPAQERVTGRVKSGNSADSDRFSGGDAQAKRRRVAPQKLTRALSGGDLSRLLGA